MDKVGLVISANPKMQGFRVGSRWLSLRLSGLVRASSWKYVYCSNFTDSVRVESGGSWLLKIIEILRNKTQKVFEADFPKSAGPKDVSGKILFDLANFEQI